MDDELDLEFLKDFASFGVYNHKLVAEILADSMKDGDDSGKKIISVKIYSEFISAIEDFAGLCVAIRDQGKMSVLGSYLFFGTKFKGRKIFGPANFFRHTEDEKDDLDKWLKFPKLSVLQEKYDADRYRWILNGYRDIKSAINQAGMWYRIENRMAVGAYNKIKHGFVVTQGFKPDPPYFSEKSREAAVLYSEPSQAKEGRLIINGALFDTTLGIKEELKGINTLLETSKILIELFLLFKKDNII